MVPAPVTGGAGARFAPAGTPSVVASAVPATNTPATNTRTLERMTRLPSSPGGNHSALLAGRRVRPEGNAVTFSRCRSSASHRAADHGHTDASPVVWPAARHREGWKPDEP